MAGEEIRPVAAGSEAADQLAILHLDDVTGEHVSKSELKRRQKQRSVEDKKKAKAEAAPPKPFRAGKITNEEDEETKLTPNV